VTYSPYFTKPDTRSPLERQAAERLEWVSRYVKRWLASDDLTENVDVEEYEVADFTTTSMDWTGVEDLTPLGAEMRRQLRAGEVSA
jgi:hypothetical protein